jgi:hypothetical protein
MDDQDLFPGPGSLLPGHSCRMTNPHHTQAKEAWGHFLWGWCQLSAWNFLIYFSKCHCPTLSLNLRLSSQLPRPDWGDSVVESPSWDFSPLPSWSQQHGRGRRGVSVNQTLEMVQTVSPVGGNVRILAKETESICDNCNSRCDNYTPFPGLCRVTLLILEKYIHCTRGTGARPALCCSLYLHWSWK